MLTLQSLLVVSVGHVLSVLNSSVHEVNVVFEEKTREKKIFFIYIISSLAHFCTYT